MSDKEEENPTQGLRSLKTTKWSKTKSFQDWKEDFVSLLEAFELEDFVASENSHADKPLVARVRTMIISALDDRKDADSVARTAGKDPFDMWTRLEEEYGSHSDNKLLLRDIRARINTCDPNKHGNKFSEIRRFLESQFRELKKAGSALTDGEKKEALLTCLRLSSAFDTDVKLIDLDISKNMKYADVAKLLRGSEITYNARRSKASNSGKTGSATVLNTEVEPLCRLILKGNCKFGKNCKYKHPANLPKLANHCRKFKAGKCNVSNCRFTHAKASSKEETDGKGNGSKAKKDEKAKGCFLCGELDHWARNCPYANAAANNVKAMKEGRIGLPPPTAPVFPAPQNYLPSARTASPAWMGLAHARQQGNGGVFYPTDYPSSGTSSQDLFQHGFRSARHHHVASTPIGFPWTTMVLFTLLVSLSAICILLVFPNFLGDGRVLQRNTQHSTANVTSTRPLLDSGALVTHTIAPRDAILLSNKKKTRFQVTSALGDKTFADTKGTVQLRDMNNRVLTLENALLVPGMTRSLISESVLTDENKFILKGKSAAAVYPPGTLFHPSKEPIFTFLRGDEDDGWVAPIQATQNSLSAKDVLTQRRLFHWHEDCDHRNFGDLRREKPWGDKFHVPTDLPDPYCRWCALYKAKRRGRTGNFKKLMYDDPLVETVYFDMSGKAKIPSLYGEQYMMLYKTSTDGYTFDSYYKQKSEAGPDICNFFTQLMTLVRSGKSRTVALYFKAVSDNAREFVSKHVGEFFKKNSIKRLTTPVKEASQRGMIEVEMRIVKPTAATALASSGLPAPFVFFSTNKAVWTRNRWRSSTRGNVSPYELRFGKAPDLSLARPFGIAGVLLLNRKEGGVGLSGIDIINLGVDDTFTPNGAHKVFVPSRFGTSQHASHIVSSPNVTFDRTPGSGIRLLRRLCTERPDLPLFLKLRELGTPIVPYPEQNSNPSSLGEKEPRNNVPNSLDSTAPPLHLTTEPDTAIDYDDWFYTDSDTDYASDVSDDVSDVSSDHEHTNPESTQAILSDDSEATKSEDDELPGAEEEWARSYLRSQRGDDYLPGTDTTQQAGANVVGAKNDVPSTRLQVANHPEVALIRQAEATERKVLRDFNVWEWSKLPHRHSALGSRFVYSRNNDPRKPPWKARFVGQGFSQVKFRDYFQTSSPTPRIETIFFVVSIIASLELIDFQGDARGAFLHAPIDVEIYMEPAPGEIPPFEGAVWLLRKAIYGLKQAGRQWFHFFKNVLLSLNFIMSPVDNCLFYFQQASAYIIFIFHVDDFTGGANSQATADWLKVKIEEKVELSHFGRLSTFIGLEFTRKEGNKTFEVRQTEYIDEVVRKFRIPDDAKPCHVPAPKNIAADAYNGEPFKNINIYQQMVGSCMYSGTTGAKGVCFSVNLLCRLMQAPTKTAWELGKCVLKFLKTKRDVPLVLGGEIIDPSNLLVAFSDADWAVDRNSRRSTTGCVIFFNGHCVFSETRLQQTVALHSVESEYYALSDTTKSVLFFRHS